MMNDEFIKYNNILPVQYNKEVDLVRRLPAAWCVRTCAPPAALGAPATARATPPACPAPPPPPPASLKLKLKLPKTSHSRPNCSHISEPTPRHRNMRRCRVPPLPPALGQRWGNIHRPTIFRSTCMIDTASGSEASPPSCERCAIGGAAAVRQQQSDNNTQTTAVRQQQSRQQ
jgi:hypothetical protein